MNPPLPDDTMLRNAVLDALASVAPEARDPGVDFARPLREQLELDSMDHLHFLVAVKQRLGLDVPDARYARMRSLDDLCAYLREAASAASVRAT